MPASEKYNTHIVPEYCPTCPHLQLILNYLRLKLCHAALCSDCQSNWDIYDFITTTLLLECFAGKKIFVGKIFCACPSQN